MAATKIKKAGEKVRNSKNKETVRSGTKAQIFGLIENAISSVDKDRKGSTKNSQRIISCLPQVKHKRHRDQFEKDKEDQKGCFSGACYEKLRW